MRIDTMNGISRVEVDPILNGLSRVNLNGLSRVNLNGLTLNGYELNGYLDYCRRAGLQPTMNGLFDNVKANRQARQGRRQERRETRQVRRDDRIENRRAFVGNVVDRASDLGMQLINAKYPAVAAAGDQTAYDDFEYVDEKALFGTPELFKDPMGWFSSKKVPTMNKVAVGVVGLGIVDGLTGGNIFLKKIGLMDKKTKRK